MHHKSPFYYSTFKGFTLIETIVGIVVLAISLSVLTTLIYPIAEQSADQLHQVKSAELAQSVLNEIQNKAFDENSDIAGGRVRCGETSAPACTANNDLGVDGTESRTTFDDVDDYNGLIYFPGNIEDSQGQLLNLYSGYAMEIKVCNDADYSGPDCEGTPDANISTAKLIIVKITTPTDFELYFSTYKANF